MAVQDWETTAQGTGLDDIIVYTIGYCRSVNIILCVCSVCLSLLAYFFVCLAQGIFFSASVYIYH